jgi:hypothetical protein
MGQTQALSSRRRARNRKWLELLQSLYLSSSDSFARGLGGIPLTLKPLFYLADFGSFFGGGTEVCSLGRVATKALEIEISPTKTETQQTSNFFGRQPVDETVGIAAAGAVF